MRSKVLWAIAILVPTLLTGFVIGLTLDFNKVERQIAGDRHQPSLIGVWNASVGKIMLSTRIDELPDGRLILIEASPGDKTRHVGDIVGEARPQGAGEWIGRHIGGGRGTDVHYWGEDGGLFIRRVSDDELFVQYRDSRYTGGWTYIRAR